MPARATAQLVELLLADDERAKRAARVLAGTGAWPEVLTLAQTWKCIPHLSARLQSLTEELPAAETATLRREFVKAYGRSAFCASKAVPAIHSLERAGIRVVAFKGIASIALLYGNSRNRTIQDADLLIAYEDLPKAVTCLEQQGFARQGSETLAEYIQFVTNSPGFAGNKAVALHGEGESEIDLHWELTRSGLTAEDILGRAARANLLGTEIPVVNAADGFLLTIHHAIRENLAIESVCRDLLDASRWCQHLQETGTLDEYLRRTVETGCTVPALAILSILKGYDSASPAAHVAELLSDLATRGERESAARLAELFHYQVGNGRLDKDVFYLVHSRPWRQILRGLGTDWSGYRKSMQTIEEQLGQQRPLHERAAQLAKSIPGVRGLKLARELARIKYGAN